MSLLRKLGTLGVAAAAATTVAACGSSGSGVSPAGAATPSWAKSLGSGVTVTAGNASANDGTPGGLVQAVVQADESGNYKDICPDYPPAEQASCSSSIAKEPASALKTALPTYKNITVTYTAIKGTQALVGVTGTVCTPNQKPGCFTNNDPAAILDSGKTFAALWTETSAASSSGYSLAQASEIGGKWYIYDSSS